MHVFECVPNVSEGTDLALVDACARAIESAGVTLAHRTSDSVHNRSVFTFFGSRACVLDAALALAAVTTERIDLRAHRGAHPRIGALDVLPFVAFGTATEADAIDLAREAAAQIWKRFRVPSYYYGAAANRLLADVRAGGFEGLAARGDAPDVGDAPHPRSGAIAVGVRKPLVAFNVVLETGDISLARRIAGTLRERGGGLRTLRVLGIPLGNDRVQISCNLTDPQATPLHRVVGTIRALAARAGVGTLGTELIGLVPRAVLEDVVAHALDFDVRTHGVSGETDETTHK
jgi:glutamate formiminotransferase